MLYGMISKKSRQATNFIYDLSNTSLDSKEIDRQISYIYGSTHTMFVDKIILFKDDEIIKVYQRKKK